MKKKTKAPVTLILNPTYKGIAYVAYESPTEILDYGLKRVERGMVKELLDKTEYLFGYCTPDIVLLIDKEKVKNPSKNVLKVMGGIQEKANENKLETSTWTFKDIDFYFNEYGVKTKYERSKLLISWFPMLKSIAPKERVAFINSHYFTPVFDVFALLVVYTGDRGRSEKE